MNKDEEQFPKAIPTLVDILNSDKKPKPTKTGVPNLKEILDDKWNVKNIFGMSLVALCH